MTSETQCHFQTFSAIFAFQNPTSVVCMSPAEACIGVALQTARRRAHLCLCWVMWLGTVTRVAEGGALLRDGRMGNRDSGVVLMCSPRGPSAHVAAPPPGGALSCAALCYSPLILMTNIRQSSASHASHGQWRLVQVQTCPSQEVCALLPALQMCTQHHKYPQRLVPNSTPRLP